MTLETTSSGVVLITVTTRVLFDNYFSSAKDYLWDSNEHADPEETLNHDLMRGCITGNMDLIRDGFRNGYAMMMLWSEAVRITAIALGNKSAIEIRVYHEGKLIGVVVESEINI